MESKRTGWNFGGKPLHGLRERSSFFVVAVLCLVSLSGVARAQTCPTAHCTTNAQCHEQPVDKFCTTDICVNPGPNGNCFCVTNTCDDNLFCTDDLCNETTDACEHTAHSCQAPTPYCDEDLDSCVHCLQDGQCTTPPRLRCNSSGNCVQCESSVECQDSSYCNGFESCNLSTGLCQAGTPVTCTKKCFMGTVPPNTTCTSDANCGTGGKCLGYCNDTRQVCVQCKVDANCDDGKFCNGAETCVNDQCVVGTAPVCKKCVGGPDNLQPCSTPGDCRSPGTCTGAQSYCDEVSNQCVQCLNPSHCEDLNFCTTNACVFNSCAFATSLAICSDGAFCNGDEMCNHVLGNDCSLFRDRAHCCFKGICSTSNPPKGCNSNADCPAGTGTCDNSTATSCNANHSTCSVDCGDGLSCTVDNCNEAIDLCQHTPNNTLCPGSNLVCNGTETCQPSATGADPVSGCVAGTPMDCTSFNTDCSIGACVETPAPPHCLGQAMNQGLACDDHSPCTALSKCNNGSCVDNPPAANDTWRCVRLEWRASGPTTVLAGSTVQLGLYAVAIGCNTGHDSNKRCVGGAVNGNSCTTDANCRVCVGGTNAGAPCTTPAPCSGGGTCPAGGTCTDLCPSTSLPISSVDALFSWNKTFLQLNPSTGPDPNPQDSCASPTACTACPIDTYNWPGTGGFSGWINDCNGDALNNPCNSGVPSLNDGNARYLAFRGINQNCPDGCATTAGLKISTIKFKAISGGTSSVALLPCFGTGSKTGVISPLVFEDVPTSDVTKSLGGAISITVTCDSHDDCNDNNNCTTDTCNCTTPSCGGTCLHANNTNTCNDNLFCTTNDRCSVGQCIGDSTTCKRCAGGSDAGRPCATTAECAFPGTCTGPSSFCQETNDRCVGCLTAANCNDGLGNTIDTCVKTCSGGTNIDLECDDLGDCPGPGGACESDFCENTPIDCNDNVACTVDVSDPVTGVCSNTPNHAFCNPLGSFCSAAICDPVDGCILDHECISLDGNPCPNPATCNEGSRTCGGCKQPNMVSAGPRYLAVTPADQGSTPVALLVTGNCGDPTAACVYRYVQSKCSGGSNNGLICNTDADCPKRCVGGLNPGAVCTTASNCPAGDCAGKCDAGTLGSTPFYKTTAQWGTAKVRGAQIRPGTTYFVHTECNFVGGPVLSSAARAKTWKWGDVDNNMIVNGIDVTNLVNFLKGILGPFTFEQMNIWGNTPSAPCTPDTVINALDIAVAVDATKGFAYPCGITCP